jgi:hypothetical protein
MAVNYSWSFTTADVPDNSPPAVLSVTPADGATGVALDSAVSVAFSEAIDLSTLNGNTFGISGVSGKISYSSATNTATFTPDAPLAAHTAYTATAVGIKDLAGNPLADAKSWTFTTGYITATGSMNGNEVVDIGDAVLALRATVSLIVPTDEQSAPATPLKNNRIPMGRSMSDASCDPEKNWAASGSARLKISFLSSKPERTDQSCETHGGYLIGKYDICWAFTVMFVGICSCGGGGDETGSSAQRSGGEVEHAGRCRCRCIKVSNTASACQDGQGRWTGKPDDGVVIASGLASERRVSSANSPQPARLETPLKLRW